MKEKVRDLRTAIECLREKEGQLLETDVEVDAGGAFRDLPACGRGRYGNASYKDRACNAVSACKRP